MYGAVVTHPAAPRAAANTVANHEPGRMRLQIRTLGDLKLLKSLLATGLRRDRGRSGSRSARPAITSPTCWWRSAATRLGGAATAHYRFPYNPPATKQAYFYREIFESHFPGQAAAACVPGSPSIACSTPAAIAWDTGFAKNTDPSGRAVLGVHQDANAKA